jgi:malate dehydrogenase (quinone)
MSAPSSETQPTDVVLIGAGIMSATLASMLTTLDPSLKITVLERQAHPGTESSDPWNNAGTGHSGYCELNYMPDPSNGAKAADIARQFHLSRGWWAHLTRQGLLNPGSFIHTTAHMDLVFGDTDADYLAARHATLRTDPLFAGLEHSEDPARIAEWAPLTMAGRAPGERVAATRHPFGTDVDFGALTRSLLALLPEGSLQTRTRVTKVTKMPDGGWEVGARDVASGATRRWRAKRVFAGAGGMALRLLQATGIDEVKGYGVLPVGAAFLRCTDPEVVAQHRAKVYGQAELGAPPMSVPHLDARIVDGEGAVMFGPYATFSTKLLKAGSWGDFFTTLRWNNLTTVASAAIHNVPLIRYLVSELLKPRSKKLAALRRYYPEAKDAQWELIPAGQRAQLVAPGATAQGTRVAGELRQGTELVTSADGSVSGLLGASPGASTAVPIMLELLETCFPEQWEAGWRERLAEAIPGLAAPLPWSEAQVRAAAAPSAAALGLDG